MGRRRLVEADTVHSLLSEKELLIPVCLIHGEPEHMFLLGINRAQSSIEIRLADEDGLMRGGNGRAMSPIGPDIASVTSVCPWSPSSSWKRWLTSAVSICLLLYNRK